MKKTVFVDVSITPMDIAKEFLAMDGNQQATVFSMMAYHVETDWKRPFCMQLQHITDSEALTAEGRALMVEIGEYGHKQS